MNKGKSQDLSELDDTTLEAEDMATHQENIPVPALFGTRLVAVRWITPALNMVTVLAPNTKPGKK